MDISSTQTIAIFLRLLPSANNFFCPSDCCSIDCCWHTNSIYSLICAPLHYRMCDRTTCGVVRSINLICKHTFNIFLEYWAGPFLRIFPWGTGGGHFLKRDLSVR